jgi:hypothetical protein
MKPLAFLLFALFLVTSEFAYAGSATWNLNPTSGDWNTPTNWTPVTVPDGADDTASLEASNVTDISQATVIRLAGVTFNPGASAFTITSTRTLTISGIGLTNNSGIEQNFAVVPGEGKINFTGRATAGGRHYHYKSSRRRLHDGYELP